MQDDTRAARLSALDRDAELLAVEQLDLLAQVEAQVRAVNHTMRRIEKLRETKYRVGPELSNGQRQEMLQELRDELRSLDTHLGLQHVCGREMQTTVERMQRRVSELRRAAEQSTEQDESAGATEGPNSGGSAGAQ